MTLQEFTKEQLTAVNPDAAEELPYYPYRTDEKVSLEDTIEERGRVYLMQRALNISVFYNTRMEHEFYKEDGYIGLRTMHYKKD